MSKGESVALIRWTMDLPTFDILARLVVETDCLLSPRTFAIVIRGYDSEGQPVEVISDTWIYSSMLNGHYVYSSAVKGNEIELPLWRSQVVPTSFEAEIFKWSGYDSAHPAKPLAIKLLEGYSTSSNYKIWKVVSAK